MKLSTSEQVPHEADAAAAALDDHDDNYHTNEHLQHVCQLENAIPITA
jgi:hypothetical protein